MGCHRSASGELDIVGRTTPLPPACTAEVAESITAARPDHPWPEMLPPSWASSGRQPVAWSERPVQIVCLVQQR